METGRRSSFLFSRIFFDEPASTSSENAPERSSIRWNRISALALWFGRVFFDEPVSTSSETLAGRVKHKKGPELPPGALRPPPLPRHRLGI